MATKVWIKLYIEILDDAKMARLPNHLWRRAVELFLLAGREGNDGALPPVEEMAWTLRLDRDKLLEDLQRLAEIGVVHACTSPAPVVSPQVKPGTRKAELNSWFVTHFKERQATESSIRVKRYRERYKERYSNGTCNGEAAEVTSPSSSTSGSGSHSDSMEEGMHPAELCLGGGEEPPRTPAQAMAHPDLCLYSRVTRGRIPGLSQYTPVIEAVRYLRGKLGLDDEALAVYLEPFWLAWSGRKRKDGRPYDPGNITWLTEWALNGAIPPGSPSRSNTRQDQAEVIRRLAREPAKPSPGRHR